MINSLFVVSPHWDTTVRDGPFINFCPNTNNEKIGSRLQVVNSDLRHYKNPVRLADFMKRELALRVERDADYTYQDFAAEAGISKAYLSLILQNKRRISEKTALKICERLKLNSMASEEFMNTYRLESSSDPNFCKILRNRISPTSKFKEIDATKFTPISRWYHTAILELTYLADFRPNPFWIARRLGISIVEAELALERLFRLGFLKKTKPGTVKVNEQFTVKTMPSRAIREHHTQMVTKALHAIEGQPGEHRDISGITIATDRSKLPLARAMIEKFREELAEAVHCDRNNAVYQLNIQYFRIDKEPKP
jgi:uncharacterized protein (TIGR02147 family)